MSSTAGAVLATKAERHFPHHPECHTVRCARHADHIYNAHRRKERERREAREAREHPTVSGLEECIIQHESGGDPQAVYLGHYGIGQWLIETWLSDGGGRYSSTPLGASYAQQEKILRGEGEAGMIDQQGQYDGCG